MENKLTANEFFEGFDLIKKVRKRLGPPIFGVCVTPEALNTVKNLLTPPRVEGMSVCTATPIEKLTSIAIAVDQEQKEPIEVYYNEILWKGKLFLLEQRNKQRKEKKNGKTNS